MKHLECKNIFMAVFPILIGCGVLSAINCTPQKSESIVAPWYPNTNDKGDRLFAVYEGRIPNTERAELKIKVGLALYSDNNGEPTTFMLARVFVGEGDTRNEIFGTCKLGRGVVGYPDAVVVELENNVPEDWRNYWIVNDTILLPIDRNRSPKIGNASWGYMLSKTK